MAAKRKGRKRRRRSSGFLWSFLTVCIVIAATVMSVTVFLKVAEIKVSGTTRYNHEDIIAVSGIKTGENMFLLNKFEVADRILKAFPYIEQIKIRRRLPDTFTFEITERVPAAYVIAEGNRWLIDKKGYLLEMLDDTAEVTLPKISGAEVMAPYAGSELVLKNQAQLAALCDVLSSLAASEMSDNIVRIEIEKLYDIRLVYADRFMVILGDTEELEKKIEMLKAVLLELNEMDKGTINISVVGEARFKPDAKIDLSDKTVTTALPQKEPSEPPTVPEEAPMETPEMPVADESGTEYSGVQIETAE